MAKKRDYYEILGIAKNASSEEIKRAFRKLAKQYHPDVSSEPEAEKKFKEINEAYQVLSDSKKRAQYDRFGHRGINFEEQGFGDFANFNFSDIFQGFSDFFGGGNSWNRSEREGDNNLDQYFTIKLTFFEAMHGVKKNFIIKEEKICELCQGKGAEKESDILKCFACNGQGYQIARKSTIFGVIQQEVLCSKCRGLGKQIKKKCQKCAGKKIVFLENDLEVNVPKGVDNRFRMKFSQKGKINPITHKKGDLYTEFMVERSPIFKRENNDLFTDIPISYLDALLGKEIKVPTIDGIKTVELEAGTKNGKIIRLKNYGAHDPSARFITKRGHQYYRVLIQYPDSLTREERAYLIKMSEETDFKPNKDYIAKIIKKGWAKEA